MCESLCIQRPLQPTVVELVLVTAEQSVHRVSHGVQDGGVGEQQVDETYITQQTTIVTIDTIVIEIGINGW